MSDQEGLGASGDPDRPGFARPEPTGGPGPGQPPGQAGSDRSRPWPDLPPRPGSTAGDGSPTPPSQQSTAQQSTRQAARRRRGRRRGIAALVVVVLILAALVVADRVGVGVAEKRVATQLQTQLQTPEAPTVDIPDVPFLTQAATGHYGEVRIAAENVPPTGKNLALKRLDLTLHDVRASGGYRTLEVARVDGTARFDYAALSSSIGSTATYAGKDGAGRDRVQVEITTTIFGRSIAASITGPISLNVSAQSVTLVDPEVRVGGVTIPAALASQLTKAFEQPVSMSGLPSGIGLSSLTADPDGLSAGLAGENVTLTTR